jgi:hypothetical protein
MVYADSVELTDDDRARCESSWAERKQREPDLAPLRPCDYRTFVQCAWRNWFGALEGLYVDYPDADAYLIVQDDVVFAKNLRTFLSYDLWPETPERCGAVSLYCSHRYTIRKPQDVNKQTGEVISWWAPLEVGCSLLNPKRELWGALALVFSRDAAQELLNDPKVHTSHSGNRIDQRIRAFCARHNRGMWIYRPSLAQHVGIDSATGHGLSDELFASDFVGQHVDLVSLLHQE